MPDIVLTEAERQPCEVWTRVMGYFRPVSEFNIGKKAEYAERVGVLEGLTKTVIPASSLCPEMMPRYNSWTAPTASAPAA